MPSTLINATATSNKIPHDPALPNMPTALDTNAMRDILQSRVVSPPQVGAGAEARYEIRDCAIVRVKYKAGRYCQVSYQLDMFDRVQQKEIRQILSARVYQRGVSQSRYQKAMKQNLAPTNLDEPVYHLPELDMVIWVFPNDRKLNKLAPFVDRNSVEKNVLPEIIHNRYGAGWELTGVHQ
ncbi:MAG: hypothetical protein ACE5I1_07075, partial [bacterium]